MARFGTILFATDLSERADAAFPVVRSLAGEGRLVVLHAVEQVLFAAGKESATGAGLPVFWPSDSAAQREALEQQLRAAYPADGLPQVEYKVSDGDAADVIVRASRATNADLIALGTHARRGMDRLFSGSVAETVLHRAQCAVLVHHLPEELLAQSDPTRLVVHATDFSSASESAFTVACALARVHGARLVLLHAEVPDQIEPDEADRQLDALRARADSDGLGGVVEIRLTRGQPVPEILRATAESDGSVVVLGTHGRTGLGRMLLGSTAEAMLRAATRPVVVVKPAV